VPIVLKSGSFNLLEPYGPVQGRYGITLPAFILDVLGVTFCSLHILLNHVAALTLGKELGVKYVIVGLCICWWSCKDLESAWIFESCKRLQL
jgi:hypothetical protein